MTREEIHAYAGTLRAVKGITGWRIEGDTAKGVTNVPQVPHHSLGWITPTFARKRDALAAIEPIRAVLLAAETNDTATLFALAEAAAPWLPELYAGPIPHFRAKWEAMRAQRTDR